MKYCVSPTKIQCSSPGTNETTIYITQTTNAALSDISSNPSNINTNPTDQNGITTASSAYSSISGCDLSKELTPVANSGCKKFYR